MGRKRSDNSASKRELVRLALEQGMTSPTAIAEHLRQTHRVPITPAHVSTLKGDLKREKEQQQPAGEKPAPSAARTTPAAQRGSGLTPKDLLALADIAERAGGVNQLQAFLAAFKRMR